MKSKLFSPFWRVAIALVMVLSMGLVMAAPATAVNQDEAPAYVAAGDTDVVMLQFDVENTNASFSRDFTGVTVSFSGDDPDDVAKVMVLDSGETEVTTDAPYDFTTSPVSIVFTTAEEIGYGATETYYLAIDIDGGAADLNLVSIALESVEGNEEVGATATLPFSSGETEIDDAAPAFDSALTITGDSADGNSVALDKITLFFIEEGSGLDPTTVVMGDFTVAGGYSVTGISEDAGVITLTLDDTLATGETPLVTYTQGTLADEAGNLMASGTTDTVTPTDGLKPTVDSVAYDAVTADKLTLTFSEDIALPGVKTDYSVEYDPDGNFDTSGNERVVAVHGVTGSASEVALEIADQSLEDDPTSTGKFKVTLDNPGNVKDTNGNSVDPANSTASVVVADFVTGTDIVSAITVTTTTIDVTFSDDLDGATVDETGFTVVDNTVDSASETSAGVVTLTLGTAIATDADPVVDYDGSGTLEDIAGIAVVDCTDTTPADGIAPTMDSAATKDVDTKAIDVTFSEDLNDATVDAADFSVVGNTVDSATEAGGVVTLTLETEIATNATPDVTYTAGSLADLATVGNTAVTDTVTPTDGAGPVLETVTWIDVNEDEEVSPMDTLTFTFSEAMDQSTITRSNVDTNLAGTYGTGAVVSWTATDTVVVTLAIGETVAIGGTVNPHGNVTDALGNADATVADVTIEDLTDLVLLNGVHYPAIQAAINAAAPFDTIQVGPGTYEEDLTIGVADLTLESTAGEATTTIEGTMDIIAAADNFVLGGAEGKGFTLEKGIDFLVRVHGATDVIISYNTFETARLTGETQVDAIRTGQWEAGTSGLAVRNNTFILDGLFDMGVRGHNAGDVIGLTVADNTFTGAGSTLDHNAIEINNLDISTLDSTISGNDITGVKWGVVIYDQSSDGLIVGTGDTAGTLEISGNTFSDCDYGIDLLDVTGTAPQNVVITRNIFTDNNYGFAIGDDTWTPEDFTVQYNDFSGNTYAVYNNETTAVYAINNSWDDVTGPSTDPDATTPTAYGAGDPISANVDYSPWLHKSESECEINSFPALTVDLSAGWNTLSAPAKLITTADSVGELVPSGSGMIISYWYDAADVDEDGAYWESGATHVLNPCDAVYIKMSSAHTVLFQVDGAAFYTPTKDLIAGWNLIGLARLEPQLVSDAVASVGESYAQVVSPSMNYGDWVHVIGTDYTDGPDEPAMEVGEGYWIFMKSGATLGGFTLCPIAPQY